MFSLDQCATLACLLDVSVPKPGNVHRGADFEDVTFLDFVLSAVAIGPVMARAPHQRLGATILDAVRATSKVTDSNTNLGIILLLAPLATVAPASSRRDALRQLLGQLSSEDASDVYEAIRLAQPGGLGASDEMDVNDPAPDDLMAAMAHARDRDAIALQYVTHFERVFDDVAPCLAERCGEFGLVEGVLDSYVTLLARFPDSLIARKCGETLAAEVSNRANQVLKSGRPATEARYQAMADFDFWLRSDGHRRNPGTTADMITAGMFLCLLEGTLPVDSQFPLVAD